MYYTVYKVTNQINGKVYIGCHKTEDLKDDYMGSGKYLKYSQEKHGLENFTKDILFVFDNPEDMFVKEGELVTEDFIAEENTYNLKVGGYGGVVKMRDTDYHNSGRQYESVTKAQQLAVEYHRQKRLERIKSYDDNPFLCGTCDSPLPYKKRKNKYCDRSCAAKTTNLGKVKSSETRRKISQSVKNNLG